ncbi:MAG: cytochrome c oxidase subunit II [Acidobacteria bacterium]|nr:MAG: cytochrome c oxidase subunit II [Acidobacteriota bacterium]
MKFFDFPLFPETASTLAREVDAVYFFALSVSAFFSLLIALFIFIFFVKYRRQRTAEIGVPIHGSTTLEIVWSLIPLVITMVLFAWGAKVFLHALTPPPDAREYFATGKQWMWKIQHPEGQREINQLHVPVGEPIKLTLTSEDVIHSFYIPAFRVKHDVLPGRYTTVWFEATRTGTYHLFCAEYCGTEHSKMIGTVTVMEPDDYETWLAGGPAKSPVASGAELFVKYACNTCHMEAGSGRGPLLHGIYGQPVTLAGGQQVVRDDNYLRESILRSGAKVVAGYQPLMPVFQGQISEEGVMHLIAYIKSLTGDESPGAAGGGAGAADGTGG